LSDHFAKAFDVQYLDMVGERKYVHQTSWGLSTRSIGGLVLSHGDDSGLILPPKIAPVQVVVVAVGSKAGDNTKVESAAMDIAERLKAGGIRTKIDTDFTHSLGFRINAWELKGVPLRLEVGMRDLEAGTVVAARRDTFAKDSVPQSDLAVRVNELLDQIQESLLEKSKANKRELTVDTEDYAAFKSIMASEKKFIRALWCESRDCEAQIKKDTTATPRVLEMERLNEKENGICVACGEKAQRRWLFAQSY
jgi:prolyl-tRNA synthetase